MGRDLSSTSSSQAQLRNKDLEPNVIDIPRGYSVSLFYNEAST